MWQYTRACRRRLSFFVRFRYRKLELLFGEPDGCTEAPALLWRLRIGISGHLEHLLRLAALLCGVGDLLGERVREVVGTGGVEMYVEALLAAEAGEGGVTADRVDAEGEADDGPVERLVELEPAHDSGRTADRFHLFHFGGDDYVSLWGTHRLAALRGDHTRLHASSRHRPGEALPDALGEIQALAFLLCQRAYLSKKRAK